MLIVVSGFTHSRYPVGYVPLYLKTLPFSEPDCVANAVALSDTFGYYTVYCNSSCFSFKFIAPLLAGFTRSKSIPFSVFTFDCIYGH
jgi:hypothetical protein